MPLPLPGLQDQALNMLMLEESRVGDKEEEKEEKENSPTSSNTPTSNLPPGLLEKVRAKEAAKAVREMTRTAEEKKRIERLRRMPDLARFEGQETQLLNVDLSIQEDANIVDQRTESCSECELCCDQNACSGSSWC